MLLASVLPLIDSGLVNVLLRAQSAAALVNLGSREQSDWVVRALIQRPLSGMGDDQLELTVMSSAAMVAKSVADLLGRPAGARS
ncbi:hypothetical protein [Corynebacterium glyciniphilum]|uniref:hypothetical protein n=1 Tax=Corynebacterium glyciniphilum TaxID=1404244 RepID=UPI003DA1B785